MKKKLNIALIGCGRIAARHAQILQDMDDVNLVAVADTKAERAGVYAEKYGAKAYADYHEMLEKEDIDIVNVLTPSGNHAEIGIDVARSGRHVGRLPVFNRSGRDFRESSTGMEIPDHG